MKPLDVPQHSYAVGYAPPLPLELSPGWVDKSAVTVIAVCRDYWSADMLCALMAQLPLGHQDQFTDPEGMRWVSISRERERAAFRVRKKYRAGSADAYLEIRKLNVRAGA